MSGKSRFGTGSWRPPVSTATARIEPRGDGPPPWRFRHGAHAPFAIRWFGSSALLGHMRFFIASAIATEAIDARDWMRPESPAKLLRRMARVLGCDETAPNLSRALGREVWIDFVSDTGDDRDIAVAVATMVFSSFEVADGNEVKTLPRGDVLLFGGDTAYPVASEEEIARRLIEPWNEVLDIVGTGGRSRVLLGVPGNHDWYDGLDGFARFFRRDPNAPLRSESGETRRSRRARRSLTSGRKAGLFAKQLHLDEFGASIGLVAKSVRTIRAFVSSSVVRRRKRLALSGYEAVQEASYWAFPLADGLDIWGLDRQLRKVDYRQRLFVAQRREQTDASRLFLCASDPVMAFGEPNVAGNAILKGCDLRLEKDPIFYLCGDIHHYERRKVGSSMHVIAGGGGAFLHGTRIEGRRVSPAERAYPDAKMSTKVVLKAPYKMMIGQAGFLPHMGFATVAMAYELFAYDVVMSRVVTVCALFLALGGFGVHCTRRGWRPHLTIPLTLVFAALFGFGPMALHHLLPALWPRTAGMGAVVSTYTFVGALLFGIFLTLCALLGLEHEHAFAALGHPGFKHFVRIRVGADGSLEAWVIGKDDPLSPDSPKIIDHFKW